MWVVIGDALIALNRHSRNTINYNLILYRVLSEPEPKAVNKISSSPSRLFDGSMIINFISFDSRWDLHFTSRGLHKCCFAIFNDFLLASWAPICNIRREFMRHTLTWNGVKIHSVSQLISISRETMASADDFRPINHISLDFARTRCDRDRSRKCLLDFFFCYKIKNVSPGSTLERAHIGE